MTNTKHTKRLETVASYYHRHRDSLREKARLRMARVRAENAMKSEESKEQATAALCASQAKYHISHREILCAKEARKALSNPDPSPRADGDTNEDCEQLHVDNPSDDKDHEPLSDTSNSGYFGNDNPSDDKDKGKATLTDCSSVVKATVMPPRKSFLYSRSEMPKLLPYDRWPNHYL
ncbi:hypothetical protein BDN71DRAFT_1512422 [Pleurotus eryngii]|uniref:Uncharacterized protein n=1 Tax=Pleurotus eryngii TaxID=5323 RepID=A0A9P5ZJX7_PLEER|nr:hypothetical protein BDN71DRAFT_1512422 [Pleurotus eryngii]